MVVLSLGNLISLKNLSPLHDFGVGAPSAFCARDKVVRLKTVLKVGRQGLLLLLLSSLCSVQFFFLGGV